MTKLLSGIGPPRTTALGDVSAAVTNDVAVVTSVDFSDPAAVWMYLDQHGTLEWRKIAHEDHNGLDSPAELGQRPTLPTSSVVKIDGDYYQHTDRGAWNAITPFEVDEQPGPTVSTGAQSGSLYVDRRTDSALYQLDQGTWSKEAEGLGSLVITDPQTGDTLAYDDPPGHWTNVPATVILEFDGGTVTNAAEFLDDVTVDGAFVSTHAASHEAGGDDPITTIPLKGQAAPYIGTWDIGTSYNTGEVVRTSDEVPAVYQALVDTTGDQPGFVPEVWQYLSFPTVLGFTSDGTNPRDVGALDGLDDFTVVGSPDGGSYTINYSLVGSPVIPFDADEAAIISAYEAVFFSDTDLLTFYFVSPGIFAVAIPAAFMEAVGIIQPVMSITNNLTGGTSPHVDFTSAPGALGGIPAPPGSACLAADGTTGTVWVKTGPDVGDWDAVGATTSIFGAVGLDAASRPAVPTQVVAVDVDDFNAIRTAMIALGIWTDGD